MQRLQCDGCAERQFLDLVTITNFYKNQYPEAIFEFLSALCVHLSCCLTILEYQKTGVFPSRCYESCMQFPLRDCTQILNDLKQYFCENNSYAVKSLGAYQRELANAYSEMYSFHQRAVNHCKKTQEGAKAPLSPDDVCQDLEELLKKICTIS